MAATVCIANTQLRAHYLRGPAHARASPVLLQAHSVAQPCGQRTGMNLAYHITSTYTCLIQSTTVACCLNIVNSAQCHVMMMMMNDGEIACLTTCYQRSSNVNKRVLLSIKRATKCDSKVYTVTIYALQKRFDKYVNLQTYFKRFIFQQQVGAMRKKNYPATIKKHF